LRKTILILGVFSLMVLIHGCDADEGEHDGVGYIPKIVTVQGLRVNDPENPVVTNTFNVGDTLSLSVRIQDNDKNAKVLWVTLYQVDDPDTPYEGPVSIDLPTQTSVEMTYIQIYTTTLTMPSGTYLIILQCEDSTGNTTDTYSYTFLVQ